ncbi:MAG: hypothetical protein JWR80_8925 [Bradyrhizobium sp.]|nr:hypothetical protein [Bradyrhizobium sp.]
MNGKALADMAGVVAATVTTITALCVTILWAVKRRQEASRRLSVRIERSTRDRQNIFHVVVEYLPAARNQALFVDIGSLGANPIYLFPRLHPGLPEDAQDGAVAEATWPKDHGQLTSGRLRVVPNSELFRAVFRIAPRTTDAGGWLHVRVFTQTPRKRTVIARRIPVRVLE